MMRRAIMLAALALSWALSWTTEAAAHRPGESYIFLDLTEDALRGEIHVRLSDLENAVPMDADGDGVISRAEFDAAEGAVKAHFQPRLIFHSEGRDHAIRLGGHDFFGPDDWLIVMIDFEIPTLGPTPRGIGVSYRFLYDEADPKHVPMLLINSSTRLGLTENERHVSLVFGPGAERQALDLSGRSRAEVAADFLVRGARRMLASPVNLLFVLALLLPIASRRRTGGWEAGAGAGETARAALAAATAAALGFAATLAARLMGWHDLGAFAGIALTAGAAAVAALDAARPFPRLSRPAVAALAGAMLGLAPFGFGDMLGLDMGRAPLATAAFSLGIWAAILAAAAVAAPALLALGGGGLHRLLAHRFGPALAVAAAGAWFAWRALAA